jgi:uncharacterized OB-fold protein
MVYGPQGGNVGKPAASNGYDKPLPVIDALTKGFWDHAKQGRLAMQVCTACGDVHFPASPVCPKCLSEKQSWRPVSGEGVLYSWVVFHQGYWAGMKEALPYPVCMVELAEGPLFLCNLVGDRSGLRAGAPVRVTFEKVSEEITLPQFALA